MPGVINDSRSDVLPSPTSYAVQKPQPIMVNAPLASQAAKAGVRATQIVSNRASDNIGEARAAAMELTERQRASLAALSPMIAKKLKRMEEQEFAEGYMRHLQGESVAAIGEDDPFSAIFGDGAAVRGARARQAEASGQALMAWVEENKGDLGRMSLDEQRIALADYVESMATGDEQADVLIAQGAMKTLPPIMDNLARAHIEEQQKQAAIQQAETIKQGADNMKFAAQEVAYGRMSEGHFAELQAQYLESIRPLPGQSQESYRQAMTGNYMMLLKDGQFDMAATILDEVINPLMTPDEALQLYVQGKQAQSLWLMDNPLAQDYMVFTETLPSQIMAGRFTSAEGVLVAIDKMNAEYMKETGNVYPLIDNKARGGFADMFIKNQLREAEKASDRAFQMALKQQEAQTKMAMYMQGYAQGNPALMGASGLDGVQKYAIDAQVAQDFFTNPDGGSAQTLGDLAVNGYVNPLVQQEVMRPVEIMINGGIPSQEAVNVLNVAVQKMSKTPYAEATLQAYFGDKYPIVKEMQTMDMSNPKNLEYIKDRAQTKHIKLQATADQRAAAADAVSSLSPGWWSTTFGNGKEFGQGMTETLKMQMEEELLAVNRAYPNLPEKSALQLAEQKVKQNNTFMGNYAVTGDRNRSFMRNVNANLDIPMQTNEDPRFNSMVENVVKQKLSLDGTQKITGKYEVAGISVVNNNGYDVNIQVLYNGRLLPIRTNAEQLARSYNVYATTQDQKAKEYRNFDAFTNKITADQFQIKRKE